MYRNDSKLRFEDEENLEPMLPKQEVQPKMQMKNPLPPFLGGNANYGENIGRGIGAHQGPDEHTMDQMQPHTQQPLIQNQQGVQVTPELITKILKEI